MRTLVFLFGFLPACGATIQASEGWQFVATIPASGTTQFGCMAIHSTSPDIKLACDIEQPDVLSDTCEGTDTQTIDVYRRGDVTPPDPYLEFQDCH